MTSKKSFLVSLKTNLKRRIWLLVVMILALTFSMPMYLAMALSTEKMYYSYRDLPNHLGKVFAELVGINGMSGFLIAVLAIVSAVQGFSYMYQQKKLDMYMSVPVSKERRFAVIYVNGILVFLIPYLINLGLCFLVGKTMGANVLLGVGEAGAALIGNCIFYLSIYHVTILAVMLTGNLIVTLLGTGVLLYYDMAVCSLITSYMDRFFSSHYYKSNEKIEKLLMSPIYRFMAAFDKSFTYEYNYTQNRVLHWEKFFPSMLPVFLVAIVALVLAYWCYTKKPAEVCTRAMAFPVTKGVIKVLLTSVAGLAGGIIFYSMSGASMVFMVLGLLVGTLLCHGIVEVIYDFDIRSVKNGWKSLLVSGGIVAAVFCVFQFDLIGYDRYVPEASQIDSIAFSFADTYDTFYDEELNGMGSEVYAFDHMEITDIAPVLKLAELRMGMEEPDENDAEDNLYRRCIVKYRLKNEKEAYRIFPTKYMEDTPLLNEIVTDRAYQQAAYLAYNEPLMAFGEKLKLCYDSGAELQEVKDFTLDELVAAYRKDLETFDYTDMIEECVQGRFTLEYFEKDHYINGFLPVYPSFENVNKLLKDASLYREYYVDPDTVEQLVIRNDNSELRDEYTEDNYYQPYQDFAVEETFQDPEEIKQIIPALYPDTYTDHWMPEGKLNMGFYVTVTYKAGSGNKSERYVCYYMLEDKIPDFVRERTVYSE